MRIEEVRGRLPGGIGVHGARFADGSVVIVVDELAYRSKQAARVAAARLRTHLEHGERPSDRP